MINSAYNILSLVFFCGLSKWSLIVMVFYPGCLSIKPWRVAQTSEVHVIHEVRHPFWIIYIFLERNTFLWIFGRFWEKSLEDCVSNNLRVLDYQRIENWSSLLFITDREELRRSASWTLSGIVLPEDRSRGRTKPSLSKRMKTLVESQKRRILVFRNGESSEGVEIVAGRFDEV